MPGHGHTPVEGGPADREVLEAALDEADDLVEAAVRGAEVRVVRVEGQQPVLVGRELEEVALLLGPGHLGAGFGRVAEAVGADLGLVLDEVALVADRVPAGVLGEVDVPVGFHPLPERLGRLVVVRVRGADEAAQRDAEVIAHLRGTRPSCGRRVP